MYLLTDYNYDLPEDRIAQRPSSQRDRSKLLFLNRETGDLSHHGFYELCDLLSSDDVLVVNNTEVIPGRLLGKKDTGGKAEVLILDYTGGSTSNNDASEWVFECLIKSSKRTKTGAVLFFEQGLKAEVFDDQDGIYKVKFFYSGNFENLLYRIGKVPLPPYIKRKNNHLTVDDRTSYQTVYASEKGAVAAPTAGLHFTADLIDKLKKRGIKIVPMTLHVGYGTFLPVRVSDIRAHKIHFEWFFIPKETADTINQARANNQRVVAVGTTTVRTLEFSSGNSGDVIHGSGNCDLFIYPGYRFKVVDAMITNFHLPMSTLLMLVSAFAGRENIMNAYNEAIKKKYRFYSYGDAMLIL
ncbi:tRNA preQ1(34) S-adenosylmethionine ribosyltransferase-isomerase QueA [Thermodesulfobacteriota bacterium]